MPDVDERPVRFGDRERDTTSYDRADNDGILVGRKTTYLFTVSYFGGGDDHLVLLYRDGTEWRGGCDCKRWHYDGRQTGRPCAHLWAVKRANETIEDFDLSDADAALTENLTECPTCEQPAPGRREPNAQDPATTGIPQCRLLHTDGTQVRSRRRWHATPAVVDVGASSVPTRGVVSGRSPRGRGTPHRPLNRGYGGAYTLCPTVETRGSKSQDGRRPTPVSTVWNRRAESWNAALDMKRRGFE